MGRKTANQGPRRLGGRGGISVPQLLLFARLWHGITAASLALVVCLLGNRAVLDTPGAIWRPFTGRANRGQQRVVPKICLAPGVGPSGSIPSTRAQETR